MPHCNIYNSMMELTTVRGRERICTYGIYIIPVAQSAYENTKGAATERKDAEGAKEEDIDAETMSEDTKGTRVTR